MNTDLWGQIIGLSFRVGGGAVAFGFWQHSILAGLAFASLLLTIEQTPE